VNPQSARKPGVASRCFLTCWLMALAIMATAEPKTVPTLDVIHYDARVEPEIASKTVKGEVVLTFLITVSGRTTIELDRGDLTIDAVREGGQAREFVEQGRKLQILLARPSEVLEQRQLAIEYHGAPRFGLQFFPDRSQVTTVFSTSQWLVCIDDPSDRATLKLSVVLPANLTAAGSGRLVGRRTLPGEKALYEWELDRQVPTYTFGFTAGSFVEVADAGGSPRLRYLAAGFSDAELRRVFADTADMISFFEDRAGVPFPDATYTQVLVANSAGQEMSGFSVMPEDYGRSVLRDSSTTALAAHELAHQWWGNMVTCADWTHFWLNEGFATFMAAAYSEHRFGRSAYERALESSSARYEKVRAAGHDRSLVFPEWNRPSADDRTLVYHKGAYALHLLRQTLGESFFWSGIRDYTRAHFGRSVTTADFQRAMEQASGRNLSEFFSRWIYATSQ
jgi:aminopeptidase N